MVRIRQAALSLFGEQGYESTSVRQIAGVAQVSAALVLHHYGSKEALQQACDAYVLDFLAESRRSALLGTGAVPTVARFVEEHPEVVPMSRYLRRTLIRGGTAAARVFDRMASDNVENLRLAEEQGRVRPCSDPRARAALLTAWNVSMLMVGDVAAGWLGGSSVFDLRMGERLEAVAMDLFTDGLLADGTLRQELLAGAGDPATTSGDVRGRATSGDGR
ncbi:transcriptional regulator RaaS [Microlunatus panaciterrae]